MGRASAHTVPRLKARVNQEAVASVEGRVIDSPHQGGGHVPMKTLLLTLIAALPSTALAAEVVWDGHYRTQVRAFDSLSLSLDNDAAEGSSMWADHRLTLAPSLILSGKVRLFTELQILPYANWGNEAEVQTSPVTGLTAPAVTSSSVRSPSAEDGSAGLQNLQVRRVWAQLDTRYGQARFGRMPVEWGAGMVWNAGNDPLDEYGTTADRIQFIAPVGPVHLIGAYELPYEGFINQSEDVQQLTGGVAYLTEDLGIGSYNTYRWQSWDDGSEFSIFTGDIWAKARLGRAQLEWELAFQMGGGDLSESINDVRVTGLGTLLSAKMEGSKLMAGLTGGITTGDSNPYDNEYRSFAMHSDYNVALMMFEEPMPVLAHDNPHAFNNEGREYGAVRLGDGIENAMFLRPSVGYRLRDDLVADAAFILGRATKLEEEQSDARGYGSEIDLSLQYTPFEHFSLTGTGGYFMPGAYITEFSHDEYGTGFTQAVLGGRLVGTVRF
jgi:hypothetical protein